MFTFWYVTIVRGLIQLGTRPKFKTKPFKKILLHNCYWTFYSIRALFEIMFSKYNFNYNYKILKLCSTHMLVCDNWSILPSYCYLTYTRYLLVTCKSVTQIICLFSSILHVEWSIEQVCLASLVCFVIYRNTTYDMWGYLIIAIFYYCRWLFIKIETKKFNSDFIL